jgi:hypothetical protein
MPELRFEDIGRGSLAYRTQFDAEDPEIKGPNWLALAAFLGAKWLAKGGKWGAELWEKTGAKALKDLKAGFFGKGTRSAAEAGTAIEADALKEGGRGVADGLSKEAITGKAVEGKAVAEAAGSAEKLGVKEGEKIGAEVLVKEGEKGIAKTLGKKIPGVALLIGGYFAWDRFSKGDMDGAKAELESGAVASLPGIGTVASLTMDLSLLGRDKVREQMASIGIDPDRKLSPTGEVIANAITGSMPAGGLVESSTRTFVSAVEGLSESRAVKELGAEKLSAFSEGALAIEKTLGGTQLAEMTRPVAALAENMLGLHERTPQPGPASTPAGSGTRFGTPSVEPAPDTAEFKQEESRLRQTLDSQAPEQAALETEATHSGHPTAIDQVDADQARDLQQTYEQTQLRLQTLENSRSGNPQKETPEISRSVTTDAQNGNDSLLARIQAIQPSSNPRAYLPASLSEADRGGVNTARAAERQREAIDQFMGSLNVAPLSAQFRQAIRSQERGANEVRDILPMPKGRGFLEGFIGPQSFAAQPDNDTSKV